MSGRDRHARLRRTLISRLEALINTRRGQVTWLTKCIEDVESHELKVNIAKTTATTTTVASTAMLFFPPTAIFGAIGLIGSAVGGLSISVVDFINNKIDSGDLQKSIDKSKKQEERLKEAYQELQEFINIVARELQVDASVAQQYIIKYGFEDASSHVGALISGGVSLVEIAPKVKQIADAMKFGYGVLDAGFIASGTGVAMVVEGGEAFYQITGSAISMGSKVMAGVGVVFSIGDTIYSWAKDNPNLASGKTCLERINENLKELKESLAYFENIPN